MMGLVDGEEVDLWSRDPERRIGSGLIVVGEHGLPVVLTHPTSTIENAWTPWTCAANWSIRPLPGAQPGVLLDAWNQINSIIENLSDWQRRHDGMGREEPHADEED